MLIAAHRLDRYPHPYHRAYLFRPGARGVHYMIRRDDGSRFQRYVSNASTLCLQPDNFVVEERRAYCACFSSQSAQDAVGIQPAVIRRENRCREIGYIHRREFALQSVLAEPDNIHAVLLLHAIVSFEHGDIFRRDDEEIAIFLEIDPRGLVVDRHVGFKPLKERNAEVGKRDVLRQTEKPADAAGRTRRRGLLIGLVALDDGDRASLWMTPQKIGNARPDCPSTDNNDVITHVIPPTSGGLRARWAPQ